jgi:hypothetical protein
MPSAEQMKARAPAIDELMASGTLDDGSAGKPPDKWAASGAAAGRAVIRWRGLMALDGQPILIQAKWHSVPVGWGEIAPFLGPGTAVARTCR